MYVNLSSKNAARIGTPKSTYLYSEIENLEVVDGNLQFRGYTPVTKGTGKRGGKPKYFDHEGLVQLTPAELAKLLNFALSHQIVSLSAKASR